MKTLSLESLGLSHPVRYLSGLFMDYAISTAVASVGDFNEQHTREFCYLYGGSSR
jgi:hypothetical protein